MTEPSSLERTFDTYWGMLCPGLPAPETEHRFAADRKFRFDRAFPAYKIAIELEGGVHTGGRHTRGYGFEKDCEKYNLAALLGWIVLRYTHTMLTNDPAAVMDQIKWALEKRGYKA